METTKAKHIADKLKNYKHTKTISYSLALTFAFVALAFALILVNQDNLNTTSSAALNSQTIMTMQVINETDIANQVNNSLDNIFNQGTANWVGNGGVGKSYLGFKFTGDTLPSNATFISARLEFTSSQNQWISINDSIVAENNSSPLTFSSTSLPSSRSLVSKITSFSENTKWDKGKTYSIDISTTVREFYTKNSSATSVALVLTGNGSSYARKFFYNTRVAGSAPKLYITYQLPTSTTPTPTSSTLTTTSSTTANVTTTSIPGSTVNSAAMGMWNPDVTYDKCYDSKGNVDAISTANIKALHDSFSVIGPDGKRYPTWHPAIATDPATGASCRFGHEHGRDPKGSELWRTKQIQNYYYYDSNENKQMDAAEEAVTGIPFGYANEQLDVYNASKGLSWLRHEDHVGHKVEYANGEGDIATNQENNLTTGGVNVQKNGSPNRTTGVKCYYLAHPHQGVSTNDAFVNNLHEVSYFADCRDPNNAANNQKISVDMLMTFGQPGGFTKFMPLCGSPNRDQPQDFINLGTNSNNVNFPSVPSSQGDREIISRDCIEKGFLVPNGQFSGNLYEAWPASLKISDKSGKNLVSGINLLFDVENAGRYYYPEDLKAKNGYNNPEAKTNLGFTMDLCYDTSLSSLGRIARSGMCDYATNYGAIKNIKWNDPRSPFDGTHRGMYFQPGSLDNADGNEFVYADPFGKNAQSIPFPGSIKQQVSAKKLDYSQIFGFLIDPRVNDRSHDDGNNTVHVPN